MLEEQRAPDLPQYGRTCPRCAARPGYRCVVVTGDAVRVLPGVHMARINAAFKHKRAADKRQIDMFREVNHGRRRARRVRIDDVGRAVLTPPTA